MGETDSVVGRGPFFFVRKPTASDLCGGGDVVAGPGSGGERCLQCLAPYHGSTVADPGDNDGKSDTHGLHPYSNLYA